MDKVIWTLARQHGDDVGGYQQFVLQELAPAVGRLVASTVEMHVTLQEPTAYSGAHVDVGDGERPVDAALEPRRLRRVCRTRTKCTSTSGSIAAICKVGVYGRTRDLRRVRTEPAGEPSVLNRTCCASSNVSTAPRPSTSTATGPSTPGTSTVRSPRASSRSPSAAEKRSPARASCTARTGSSSPSRQPRGSCTAIRNSSSRSSSRPSVTSPTPGSGAKRTSTAGHRGSSRATNTGSRERGHTDGRVEHDRPADDHLVRRPRRRTPRALPGLPAAKWHDEFDAWLAPLTIPGSTPPTTATGTRRARMRGTRRRGRVRRGHLPEHAAAVLRHPRPPQRHPS